MLSILDKFLNSPVFVVFAYLYFKFCNCDFFKDLSKEENFEQIFSAKIENLRYKFRKYYSYRNGIVYLFPLEKDCWKNKKKFENLYIS